MGESEMTCPKCGCVQALAPECARCGLIISKYQPPELQAREAAATITFYDTAKEKKQWLLFACLALVLTLLLYRLWVNREPKYPPGIIVWSEPAQVMIKDPHPWKVGDRVIVPLADFSLRARVLSAERYRFDPMSDIAPVDLALGWGPMSDQSVLDNLEIGQGSRRFAIMQEVGKPTPPMGLLLAHSSNMHMLPANDEIREDIEAIRAGDIIELSGYLVGLQENGQWTIVSSLTRYDTGDGACEVIWVKHLRRIPVKH
jgi:hypothetical protein